MNIDYAQIGARIKQCRRGRRITQESLAEKLGVSVGYVSQVERGVTKISLDLLASIATILHCELAYFLDGVTLGQRSYLETALQEQIGKLSPTQKQLLLKIAIAIAETTGS